jgi:hypothetical protein
LRIYGGGEFNSVVADKTGRATAVAGCAALVRDRGYTSGGAIIGAIGIFNLRLYQRVWVGFRLSGRPLAATSLCRFSDNNSGPQIQLAMATLSPLGTGDDVYLHELAPRLLPAVERF